MNISALAFHAVFWSTAYVIWLLSTTSYHPTWMLRITCTGVLIGASALYAGFWTPRRFALRQLIASAIALVVCGTMAAFVIHVVYDASVGPDPRRFPLLTNIVMDVVVVLLNTLMAAVVARVLSRSTGRRLWWIRSQADI